MTYDVDPIPPALDDDGDWMLPVGLAVFAFATSVLSAVVDNTLAAAVASGVSYVLVFMTGMTFDEWMLLTDRWHED